MPVLTSGENFLRQVLPCLPTPSRKSTQDKCTLALLLSPNLESPLGCHSSIAFKMPVVHPAGHSSGDLVLLTAYFSASSGVFLSWIIYICSVNFTQSRITLAWFLP